MNRCAQRIEGTDLQDLRVIQVDDAVVLVLSQQCFENRSRLRTVLREDVALPHVVRTIASGERRLIVGDVPDQIERIQEHVELGHQRFDRDPFALQFERFALRKGDILVVEGNGSAKEIGRCALWNNEFPNCVHQNHIIRCRPTLPGISRFVLLYLNAPFGQAVMKELAVTSSGLFNLSVGKIKRIPVPLPPEDEQEAILAVVDRFRDELARLATVLSVREHARDSALRSLLASVASSFQTESAPENA